MPGKTPQEKVKSNTNYWKSIKKDSDIYKDASIVAKESGIDLNTLLGMSLGEGFETNISMTGDYKKQLIPKTEPEITEFEAKDSQEVIDEYYGKENVEYLGASYQALDPTNLLETKTEYTLADQPLPINNPDPIREMYAYTDPYSISGADVGGLDTYGEPYVQKQLDKYGLNPNLEYNESDYVNEKGETVISADFKTPLDAMKAQTALYKLEQKYITDYATTKDIDLTPEQLTFLGNVGYNAGRGNARKFLSYLKDNNMLDQDITKLNPESYKGIYYNALRRQTGLTNDASTKEYAIGGIIGNLAGGAAELFGADEETVNKVKGIGTTVGGIGESIFSPTGYSDVAKGLGQTASAFGQNDIGQVLQGGSQLASLLLAMGGEATSANQATETEGTMIDGGNLHEDGGIDLNTSPNGQINNIQKGEFMWDDNDVKYIFSNDLKIS